MDAMVYILLCLGVEYWMDGNNKCYKTPGITEPESDEGDEGKAETLFADKDVEAEKNRVMQPESCCHDAVVIRGLQTVGVRRVTFGVHAGECFGLLGPGVSGKSSVLAAVAGQAVCVRGEIFANGVTLQDQQRLSLYHARAGMAYCSQRREFAGYLTGREHLELFASLRLADASRHDVSSIVQHAIRSIKLTGEADKQVKIYGTDATRKLCVAAALLPGSSLALLDEPTNGTSSPARRAIWAFIHRESARLGKTVLLATHSMSEAEELCSTIGVMANGVLQSLGSMKALKHKFSNKGYVVSVDLEPSSDIPEIEHLISSCCGKSSGGSSSGEKSEESIFTIENYTFRHTYALRSVTSLATLFDNLEKAHLRNGVRNYTVSQASLENVFLYVIRQHDEVQEDSDGMSLSGSPLFKRDEKRLRKSAHTPK